MLACFTKSLRVILIVISPGTAARDYGSQEPFDSLGLRTANREPRTANLLGRLQYAFPALAVLGTLDERGGFRRVGCAHVLVVPLNLLAGPVGHVAEVVRLGRPA